MHVGDRACENRVFGHKPHPVMLQVISEYSLHRMPEDCIAIAQVTYEWPIVTK